jgi:hypothetical protein
VRDPEHYRKDKEAEMKLVSTLGRADFEAVRQWLNGRPGERPPLVCRYFAAMIRDAARGQMPPSAMRAALSDAGEGRLAVNLKTCVNLFGRKRDLRFLAAAAEAAGATDYAHDLAPLIPSWEEVDEFDMEKIWPFFAEHPDQLASIIESPRGFDVGDTKHTALEVAKLLPRLSAHLILALRKTALNSGPSFQLMAQDRLAKIPNRLTLAASGLAGETSQVRASAARWVGRIGDGDGIGYLRKALATERNETTQAAMLGAIQTLGGDLSEDLTPERLGAGAKAGLAKKVPVGLEWFPFDALPACRWRDGQAVDPDIVKWWVVLAFKLKDPAGSGLIPLYLSLLDKPSREAVGRLALDSWVAQDTKSQPDDVCRAYATRWVASRYSEYQQNARRWPEYEEYAALGRLSREDVFEELRREKAREYVGSAINQRGVLALATAAPGSHVLAVGQRFIRDHTRRKAQIEALVTAAAANPDPAAIQFVLSIGRSFRQATVRAKAARLAGEIAERLGWTPEQLAERTVPTGGFNEEGTLLLDYGPRQFTGRITRTAKTGALSVEVTDAAGRVVKTLPAPRATDHAELAQEAKAQLATARKELKQVAQLQAGALREAMCLQRSWGSSEWREVMVDHPVMRHLASTLVWQARPGGAPGGYQLFRPTPDRELVLANHAVWALGPDFSVSLAHSLTVSSDEAFAWRSHLGDQRILQLFDQFGGPLPAFPDDADRVDDHLGWVSDSRAIRVLASERGYKRGPDVDASWFDAWVRDVPAADLRIWLGFTGSPLPERPIPAAVTNLTFTRIAGRTSLPLAEVPPVLLAEAYGDYAQVAGAGSFDPNWAAATKY